MGDLCSVFITIRKEHIPELDKLIGVQADTEDTDHPDKGLSQLEYHEANYGLYTALSALAEEGIPFYGHNTAGSEYGPIEFCSVDGGYFDAALGWDNELVLPVNEETGEPFEEDILSMREFLRQRKLAKEALANVLPKKEGEEGDDDDENKKS